MTPDPRPLFVMALPACRGRSIGDNAIRRAQAISDRFRPVIISDSFPDAVPEGIQMIRVTPPNFNWMRRLCHVPNELGFAWAVRGALTGLAAKEKVAFLLCHGYTLAWFTGRWFRRKRGVPFGMFMHGHIFERPKGTYDPRVTAFYRAIAPTCYRETDRLFALSPAQAELAVNAGAARERVVITPNGLDLADIGLERNDVERKLERLEFHRPLRLLFVGRLSVEKGVDVMLKACRNLNDQGVDFLLTIVGAGPQEVELRFFSNGLGLDARVVFIGTRRRHELGELYLEHDIQLVPSLSEPLGNVVLEGMAGGCVVVASNTGGIPSMVQDGVNGMLVKPGDPDGISVAIHGLIEDPAKTIEMIQSGFDVVLQRFSWRGVGKLIVQAVTPSH